MTEIRLLTMKEVQASVRLCPNTIRKLVKLGRFPEPIRISSHRIAWRADDVEAWKQRGIDDDKA